MILREATIKYKGYDPYTLSKGSNKRICCSCDCCGKISYKQYNQYRNLCKKCQKRTIESREMAKLKAIKQWSNQENRDNQSKRVLQYNKDHPEICKLNSEKAIKRWSNQNERNIQSDRIKNSNLAKKQIKNQIGGQDLVKHHYIYDHSDLNKYTTIMTRSKHTKLHRAMRKEKIKIPHINNNTDNRFLIAF